VGCNDNKIDPANCGACGTACGPTSVCNAGTCGPAPTVVTPAITGCVALTLAVNGTSVYYADEGHGTISTTGTAAPIVMGEMAPTWLASQGANLYWYNKTTKTIRKAAAAGGAAADVYHNTATMGVDGGAIPDIGGFLVTPDGASMYVALGTDVLKISTATAGGGTPTTVVKEVHGGIPGAMALNGTTNLVFPTDLNGDVDAALLAAPPAICGMEDANGDVIMTTCPRLARSQGELFKGWVAVIAGRAYWADGPNLKSEMIGTTAGVFDAVSTAGTSITALAASADTIYFSEDGVVEKAPAAVNTTQAPPILIARGQMAPTSMALDATKVYWATKDCAISSAAK
jgi:hypothetical protein